MKKLEAPAGLHSGWVVGHLSWRLGAVELQRGAGEHMLRPLPWAWEDHPLCRGSDPERQAWI